MIAAAGVAAILMYHHVSARPAGGTYGKALTVTPAEFAGQLLDLQRRGCAAVTLDRLVDDEIRGFRGPCEVALTFDDGYADSATTAAPILRRFGDEGTFFVTSGLVGTAGHVSRADVRALASSGMEIGAHSVTHPDLTLIGSARALHEIRDSRAQLQAMTGETVTAFAYPAGRYTAATERIVRESGYSFAVTTNGRRLTAVAAQSAPYALPRYRVLRGRGDALLRSVFGAAQPEPYVSEDALRHIAQRRIEGNAPQTAERVALALLNGGYAEPILKVRVLKVGSAAIAGVMLSGVKFHAPVDRQSFAVDVADMIDRSFSADPSIAEVDVWAVVPIAVKEGAVVSGDLAVPADRTVFSAAVRRADFDRDSEGLGVTYWAPGWLAGAPSSGLR